MCRAARPTSTDEYRIKSYHVKIYPTSWGDNIEANLNRDGQIDMIGNISTLASGISGGISGGPWGSAIGGGTSWLQGSIPETAVSAYKNFQIRLGGARIWTKVIIEECTCSSCWLFWKRLSWVEDDESEWKLCTCGGMDLPGAKSVFQNPRPKKIISCIEAHGKELGVK